METENEYEIQQQPYKEHKGKIIALKNRKNIAWNDSKNYAYLAQAQLSHHHCVCMTDSNVVNVNYFPAIGYTLAA